LVKQLILRDIRPFAKTVGAIHELPLLLR